MFKCNREKKLTAEDVLLFTSLRYHLFYALRTGFSFNFDLGWGIAFLTLSEICLQLSTPCETVERL